MPKTVPLRLLSTLALLWSLVPMAGFAETAPIPGGAIEELVTLTGEVVAVDPSDRYITLRGPLGGEITGRVGDEVANLDQVVVGDLVTIAYYQSMALAATREGSSEPLFDEGVAAGAAAPGTLPAGFVATRSKRRVTVVAVDPPTRSIVFQGEDGRLFPVEVQRPEFVDKLRDLRVGDRLDVVVTEALIAEVNPAAPGAKPSFRREVGTLIVEAGEVVKRVGNTVILRNEKGRTFKVVLDASTEFQVNGKKATLEDLVPGMKITRSAFRILESASVEGE